MSREIKFRDYDMDNKSMRYFDMDGYDRQEHDAWGNIMQYTGIKDKNCIDIYEGDIVTDTLPLTNEPDLSHAYEVTWDNFHDIMPSEFIIGNIYQNPDLLDGTLQ